MNPYANMDRYLEYQRWLDIQNVGCAVTYEQWLERYRMTPEKEKGSIAFSLASDPIGIVTFNGVDYMPVSAKEDSVMQALSQAVEAVESLRKFVLSRQQDRKIYEMREYNKSVDDSVQALEALKDKIRHG